MRKRYFWIITGCLFLLFVAQDWALYRPGVKQLAKLEADVAQSKKQALGHNIPEEKLQDIRALIEQNSVSRFPDPEAEGHASEHLERLTAILKGLDIELLSIAPKEVKQKEQYLTSSFFMELRCNYHQFRELLDAVEKSLDLIRIDQFNLLTVQEEVVATLGVEIYLFTKE
jgi:hypothetical protein